MGDKDLARREPLQPPCEDVHTGCRSCEGERPGWGSPIPQGSLKVCNAHTSNLQLHQHCHRTEVLDHMVFCSVYLLGATQDS